MKKILLYIVVVAIMAGASFGADFPIDLNSASLEEIKA